MNDTHNSDYNAPPSRATNLETPRFKPKATFWVGAGLLIVGLSSFIMMFAVHASLKNWW